MSKNTIESENKPEHVDVNVEQEIKNADEDVFESAVEDADNPMEGEPEEDIDNEEDIDGEDENDGQGPKKRIFPYVACAIIGALLAAIVVGVIASPVFSASGAKSGTSSSTAASRDAFAASSAASSAKAANASHYVQVVASGYDRNTSTPAIVRISGVTKDGIMTERYETMHANESAPVSVPAGTYDISVAIAPVNADGSTYTMQGSVTVNVDGEEVATSVLEMQPSLRPDASVAQQLVSRASAIMGAGEYTPLDGMGMQAYIDLMRKNLGLDKLNSTSSASSASSSATTNSAGSLNANTGSSSNNRQSASSSQSGNNNPSSASSGQSSTPTEEPQKQGEWKSILVSPEITEERPIYDKDGNIIGTETIVVQEAQYEVRWVES